MIEEKEFNPEWKLEFTGSLPAKVANLIIASPAHAGALVDILLDGKMTEIGKGTSTNKPKDKPESFKKTKDLFKVFSSDAYGGNLYI